VPYRQLAAGVAVAVSMLSVGLAPAAAQQAPAGLAEPRRFDIPAGPLGAAITAFGDIAGLRVLVPTALVDGRRSPGVSGSLTPEAALARLLAGSGLTWRFTADRTVTLEPQAAPAAPGVTTLTPVTVQGDGQSVQNAYESPSGYVATRTAVGTKTDTPVLEVPQSTSVITRDNLDARNVQRDSEALLYTPGVYAEPYGIEGRYDSFMFRGFDAVRGKYRDGLRLPYGVWTSMRTETYGLERMDVLRGPTSTLYGQNNPGGVFDKITKRPPAERLREVDIQLGNFQRYQGAFDLGGPIDDKGEYKFRLTGLARSSGSQYKYNGAGSIPDDREYIAPAFTWAPSADTTLTLMADYLHALTSAPFVFNYPGPRPTRILTGEPSFSQYEYSQYSGGWVFEHRFDDVWSARQNFRIGRQDFYYSVVNGSVLQANGYTLNRSASATDETLNGLAVDNQAMAQFATGPLGHTVLFGVDYLRSTYDTRTRAGTAPTLNLRNPVYGQTVQTPAQVSSSGRQVLQQGGIYLQDQIRLGSGWMFTLGGRQDWSQSATQNRLTRVTTNMNDNAFTWRAGVNWVSPIGLAPYASYSRSFFPTSGTDFGGTPFKPTTGEQYEGGLRYQPASFDALFSAALFQLTQDNVTTPDPARPGTSFLIQTGQIRSRGIELEATASPLPGLNLTASYTYQDVEITKTNRPGEMGKTPVVVPAQMASAWADYTIQSGPAAGLGFGGGLRYVGPTFATSTNTVENASTTLVDATIHYDLGRLNTRLNGARLALNVANLFDRQYATCYSATTCAWGLDRTVIGSLKYRW